MATFTQSTRLDREDLDDVLSSVQAEYPALAAHSFSLRRGIPDPNGGHLEFYPAWEPGAPGRGRPDPGRHVIEILNPEIGGRPLRESVAGDMLHLLGAIDPRSSQPVDPTWRAFKELFAQTLTPQQMALERAIHERLIQQGREHRPFEQYMDNVRLDGYIRAGLFPLVNPAWQRPGTFTSEQRQLLEHMREYLTRPPAGPALEQQPAAPDLRWRGSGWRDRIVGAVQEGAGGALTYEQAAEAFEEGPDLAAGARRTLEGLTGPATYQAPREERVMEEEQADEGKLKVDDEPTASVVPSPVALARLRRTLG